MDWFAAISEPKATCAGCLPAPVSFPVTAAVTEIPDFLQRAPDGSFIHPDVVPPLPPKSDYEFAPWPSEQTRSSNLNERDLEMIAQLQYHADTSERLATQERIAKLKAKKAPHV